MRSERALVGYIRVMARVLQSAPVEKFLELAPAVIAAEREARERHDAALNEHKTKAREAEDKYAADVHTETGANRPSTGSAPVSRCSSW